MRGWKTMSEALVERLIDLAAEPMRAAHDPGNGAVVGDPFARGYLESVDACRAAVSAAQDATPEAFAARMIAACEALADVMPAYVRFDKDGGWSPGSPYDEGRLEGAARIRAILAPALCLSVDPVLLDF